ncbi:MAG: mechanosensitive ion channel domain-containing protein [Candidatus Acidiferrales bacterium]
MVGIGMASGSPPLMQLSPVHLSNAWKSGDKIIGHAIDLLPNLIVAGVIVALFVIAAQVCKSLIERLGARKKMRQNAAILLGRLAQTALFILGLLIAVSIVAPSFTVSDLIKTLGIGGVAIGFAFQNILQNFLAGILLLLHEPFRIGDQITVTGLEGIVDTVQMRATIIHTEDGHRVVIPNATLFTNPVVVKSPDAAVKESHTTETKPQAGEATA